MNSSPAQPNQSLIDGIEVLLAVARAPQPVGVRELGRELGMTPTRVQRFLGTLAHLGMTSRTDNRRYTVGPGIHSLSAISFSASGLAARAMTVLPALSDLDAVVALGVLWRGTVSYLYFSVPGIPSVKALGREEGYPARESSIGMLLLADKDADYLDRFFPEDRKRLGPQLKAVRANGFATVHRPSSEISIAVPVGAPAFAGLAISGMFDESDIPEIVGRLRQTAEDLAGT